MTASITTAANGRPRTRQDRSRGNERHCQLAPREASAVGREGLAANRWVHTIVALMSASPKKLLSRPDMRSPPVPSGSGERSEPIGQSVEVLDLEDLEWFWKILNGAEAQSRTGDTVIFSHVILQFAGVS